MLDETLRRRLGGVFTALVSPMRDGRLDLSAFEAHLDRQLAAGVAGLSPIGTTGEAPTLGDKETADLIALTVRKAAGKAFVIAGAGANSTAVAIEKARRAADLGADGLLVVVPYYNKPSQRGIADHFAAVAAAVNIPIMVYNVPGRSAADLSVDTFVRLTRDVPNIVAIKEASGQIDRISELRLACGREAAIFTGDDPMMLPAFAVGCDGVFSVASNLVPDEVVDLVMAWKEGRPGDAMATHFRLYGMMRNLFIESNPVPVKAALALRGWMRADVRLPLAPLSTASRDALEASLAALNLNGTPSFQDSGRLAAVI